MRLSFLFVAVTTRVVRELRGLALSVWPKVRLAVTSAILILTVSDAAWASYMELVIPGYRDTRAYGISNSGLIVGTIGAFPNGSSTNENFITSVSGPPTVFNLPNGTNFPGGTFISARGINDAGEIVGTGNVSFQQAAILRNPDGTFETISSSGACCIFPSGINNKGVIVGAYSPSGPEVGFVRDPNGVFTTVNPGNTNSNVLGINSAGKLVGNAGGDGFLFDPATSMFTTFNVPGTQVTIADGINDMGTIVGAYFDSTGASHGFIRNTNGGFSTFDFPGARSTVITSINDSGNMVGYYNVAGEFVAGPGDGVPEYHAFYATADVAAPEPASAFPVGCSLAVAFIYWRRRLTP